LLFSACRFGAPPGATTQGRDIGRLYQLLFYAAIPVAVVVYGLIFWSLLRYRRGRGDPDRMPKQFRYNFPLEILYTIVPVVVVIGLFVATYNTEKRVDRVSASPDVRVRVTAFQWQWRFEYPAQGIDVIGTPARNPEMVLPVGETVQIRLVSADVDHSFYVPDFLFKRDAIPGFPNTFDLTIDHPGVYQGKCAEFCGLNHADMNFTVRGVSPTRFAAWVARRQGSSQ
jgi:cytochrome c oxidase subunit 2